MQSFASASKKITKPCHCAYLKLIQFYLSVIFTAFISIFFKKIVKNSVWKTIVDLLNRKYVIVKNRVLF